MGGTAASEGEPAGDPLLNWRVAAAKQAIMEFVQRVTAQGFPEFVPPPERVAVFDNDGTLWCEKPMPIQLDFILRRLLAMGDQDPTLRTRHPWQARGVPKAGCHAADSYSWISPPRTSRRPSRPKSGAFLGSARSDGTGVAWAKPRCGRHWL